MFRTAVMSNSILAGQERLVVWLMAESSLWRLTGITQELEEMQKKGQGRTHGRLSKLLKKLR